MKALRRLGARVRNLGNRRGDRRLREEMEEYIEVQIETNLRAGLFPTEARRRVVRNQREFAGVS